VLVCYLVFLINRVLTTRLPGNEAYGTLYYKICIKKYCVGHRVIILLYGVGIPIIITRFFFLLNKNVFWRPSPEFNSGSAAVLNRDFHIFVWSNVWINGNTKYNKFLTPIKMIHVTVARTLIRFKYIITVQLKKLLLNILTFVGYTVLVLCHSINYCIYFMHNTVCCKFNDDEAYINSG